MAHTIINLTPHNITFVDSNGCKIDFLSCGTIRLQEKVKSSDTIAHLHCVEFEFDGVSIIVNELPPIVGTPVVLVSLPVLMSLKSDKKTYQKVIKNLAEKGIVSPIFLAPDTGPNSVVRDDQGNIIGVSRFRKL